MNKMNKKKIVVGSRDSKLAVAQTQIIMNEIKKEHPDIDLELVTIKTTGDKILNMTLDKIGGKGLFVKELDKALMDGKIDIAVHSLKDMPMEENKDIPIVAMYKRGDPRDVLVLSEELLEFHSNYELHKNIDLNTMKNIGTSSARRQLQMKELYPNIGTKSIRGNIITRLNKLDNGEFDALVLAAAGLIRVGLTNRISRYFSVEEMIPAAGQGILAIQARKDFDKELLECVNDVDTVYAATAERSFVTELDGGCSSPIAAHATIDGNILKLIGLYYNEDTKEHISDTIIGQKVDAKELGLQLAKKLKGAIG